MCYSAFRNKQATVPELVRIINVTADIHKAQEAHLFVIREGDGG